MSTTNASNYTVRANTTPNGPGWTALTAEGDGWIFAAAGGRWQIRGNDLATLRQIEGTSDTGAWTIRRVRAFVAGRR
jgi:hypothetical protein